MVNEQFSWGKAVGTALITGLVMGGAFALVQPNPVNVDQVALQKAVTDAVKAETANSVNALNTAVEGLNNVSFGGDVQTAAEKILEEDTWEVVSEALVKEELENKDWKELGRFLLNDSSATSSDVEDLNMEVTYKDIDFGAFDVDEKDMEVTVDLKVYYEDSSGDRLKKYITVEASVVDGEVDIDSTDFALTV